MATKRAKVNKTLEKAKKLVSKKGNKKTKKGAWPEGQNRPQSKAYDIENDKTVPAKRTGYRFTKEGAKKLGKQPNDRPTAEEIDKYRNQTFKVKGKVNKSGPKGVGDGSFRYLYIESRADKSDLNKARKLELGGYNPDEMLELKIFVDVYEDDYEQGEGKNVNSYEVNWLKDPQVKASDLVKYLSEELYLSENPNDYAIDDDGNIHTDQLQDDDGIHVNDKATLERWKKGEEKLYNAHYYIRPLAVKNRRPSVKELSQATGIGTYAKGGEMFIDLESGDFRNQILFDPKEVREFQKYVFSYYGKNGTFVDVMEEGIPATTGEVLKAVSQYLAYLSSPKKSTDVTWGNGDSFDREIVRDIIKYNRNPRATVEYPFLIKDMKKTPILEYGGILQPMIGGVNADPRFDIYNTTMFAEKGAKLDKGYSKKEEVIDYYLNNDIFDDPETYGVSEEDLKEANKKNDFSKLEKAIIKYHGLNDPSNVEERFEVLGLGDEYAKGGITRESNYLMHFEPYFEKEVIVASINEDTKTIRPSHGYFYPNKIGKKSIAWAKRNGYKFIQDGKEFEEGGKMAKGGKIKVRYVEENEVHDWTLEDVLDVINRDRSEHWTDYDKSDWQEGWDNWVEGEFYSLKDENGKPLNKFEDGGEMSKGGKIKVRYVEENEVHDWTLEDVLDVINRDRSEHWTDYDKSDWQEGWDNWVEGEFYSLKDENGKPLNKFEDGGEMAKGGKTHEQGYDDREDESLAMRHGKIASKDFVGSHKRREHSRRDDARFETRNK